MRYMCVKCRTVFTAAWQPDYVKYCPACRPKPKRKRKPASKRKRKRSEKAPPSTPKKDKDG